MAMGGGDGWPGGATSPLLPCSGCGTLYGECDLDFVGRCLVCFRRYIENPTGVKLPATIAKVQLTQTVAASHAHIKDIKSRKLAEDGKSVVREQAARSYFTVRR
jgi:hypothetical protein